MGSRCLKKDLFEKVYFQSTEFCIWALEEVRNNEEFIQDFILFLFILRLLQLSINGYLRSLPTTLACPCLFELILFLLLSTNF